MTRKEIQDKLSNGWRVHNLRRCVPGQDSNERPIQVWMKVATVSPRNGRKR